MNSAAIKEGIMKELDQIEASGKEGYVNGRYNYAYSEYKRGLKSCSDLVVGWEAKEDAELKARYMVRRRKFAANAAAACIKIGYYQQGLEASKLILDEGPDDHLQRRKALFRAGVCARGVGELDEAKGYLTTLLEVPDSDAATQRDVRKELKRVAQEKKRYKQFAKKIVGKESEDTVILPDKKAQTQNELEKVAEAEERRKEYQDRQRREDDDPRVGSSKPEKLMSEEDCIQMLDVLAERYEDEAIQEELKQAAFDHEMKFGKGFIIRSRMILAPLQQDLLVKHGFLDPSDMFDEKTAASGAGGSVAAAEKAHFKALGKFQHNVRYLSQNNREIAEKATICRKLALGLLYEDNMDVAP